MRRLVSLFTQDTVLAWRNGHVAVVIAIALLMIALIVFLPQEINTGPSEYVLDTLPGTPIRSALVEMGAAPDGLPDSRTDFETLLEDNRNATGVVIDGSLERPRIEIVQRTQVPEESINLLTATLDMVIVGVQRGETPSVPVERLRPEAQAIPMNLAGVPIFLAFEVGILGFLLVAVFVFQEKQEGTIRAYRVTPGGLWPYIASKTAVFTILAILYGVVVVVVARGLRANWLAILALVVWASAFMTVFGLGFAAWFRNLSHWFFPGLAVLVLNMLPFFAYIYPVFNPNWVRVIPSYSLVFALREALFPTGDTALIRETLYTGLAWLAGATVFSAVSVRARLLKGG
jgi:ABC-2 type transport system permease protein/fluoroquinolone transport system permease protein